MLLYAAALVLLSERFLRIYCQDVVVRVAVVCVLVPKGVYAWPLPSHHWVVDIAQLAALLCLSRGLRGERPGHWGAAAGVCCAYACFSLQDQGALLLLGLCALVFPWIPNRDLRRRLILGWVVGGLVVGLAFAVYLLREGSLSELIHQWIVHPAQRYRLVPQNKGWTLNALGLSWIGSASWREGLSIAPLFVLGQTFFRLVGPALLFGCPVLLWVAWRRGWAERARVGLLAAGSLAFLGTAVRRLSETNLWWAVPVPLVVVAWALGRARSSDDPRTRRAATVAASALVLASTTLAIGSLRLAMIQETAVVRGRAGNLRVPASSQEAGIQPILDAIEQHVPPGDPLFCPTGYNPLINFWTLRPNPTRYQFLSLGYHTSIQIEDALASVRASPRAAVLQVAPYGPPEDPWEKFLREERQVVWRSKWGRLHVPRK